MDRNVSRKVRVLAAVAFAFVLAIAAFAVEPFGIVTPGMWAIEFPASLGKRWISSITEAVAVQVFVDWTFWILSMSAFYWLYRKLRKNRGRMEENSSHS
jgi:hypothetical protein